MERLLQSRFRSDAKRKRRRNGASQRARSSCEANQGKRRKSAAKESRSDELLEGPDALIAIRIEATRHRLWFRGPIKIVLPRARLLEIETRIHTINEDNEIDNEAEADKTHNEDKDEEIDNEGEDDANVSAGRSD